MKQEFSAVIKRHEGINGAYIEPPFDVEEVFGAKRMKVKATFDGEEYRGSIVTMGGCAILGLTQEIRKKIGKGFGDLVFVTIEKDEAERVVEVPPDFETALGTSKQAGEAFARLSYSHKKEYVNWITGAKRDDTRTARIEKAVALLAEGKKLK